MIGNDREPTNAHWGDDSYGGKDHALPSSQGDSLTKVAPRSQATGEPPMAEEHTAIGYAQRPIFYGLALARDLWLERYGGWIVIGFTGCFAFFLLAMTATGHVPGQSFPLKSGSDIIQMIGEALGSFFCLRIALRLRKASRHLQHELEKAEQRSSNELATRRHEVQMAKRAWLAWGSLVLGTALYTCGAAIWLSYDVRMPTADIPLPGLYNLGFSGAPPFFLVGMLLLTRRSRIAIGHVRLLLDALAVLGAAFALSWFFVLGPTIAALSGSFATELISIYIPISDLFLVAVAAFLMFSPLSSRHQQPVFLRLCLGIFCLAITDGLLGYFSLSPSGFNTGTLQDILWPLSMLLLGLAAIEYPRCVAREQALAVGSVNPELLDSLLPASSRIIQISTILQIIAPFLLALFTCAVLLTAVASRGGSVLLQADLIALALIVVVGVRQALTLIENSQLTKQIHGELVVSQDELQRKRHEALTDAITGLANHRAVMNRIDEEVARCRRMQGACAVLFVDLDHFKRINDTWGHRAGDALLREVGNRLRSTLQQKDFVGRYGGEEFATVLVDIDRDQAQQAAELMRAAVADHPCIWEVEETQSAVPIAVTASIGIAVYQLHGASREALIEAADRAMYQAKHSGRNRVCLPDIENTLVQEESSMGTSDERSKKEETTVQALAAAASARDHGTDAHAQRLVHLAEATAGKLHRSEEELHLIRLAALLHDLGKIGIPDAILHKPGPLTEEEWAIMRGHPEIGQQILVQAGGVFELLSRIVVAHHERWDGRGYPHGLAKEAIPISARILCVVDSYDAMISDRPYRKPRSAAEARAQLQHCSGSQFDPMVVEAFLQVLDEREALLGEKASAIV
ncbi:MAG: diguanylate cyclase domain-containing protein [Ktedonobacteraceae bacterium]